MPAGVRRRSAEVASRRRARSRRGGTGDDRPSSGSRRSCPARDHRVTVFGVTPSLRAASAGVEQLAAVAGRRRRGGAPTADRGPRRGSRAGAGSGSTRRVGSGSGSGTRSSAGRRSTGRSRSRHAVVGAASKSSTERADRGARRRRASHRRRARSGVVAAQTPSSSGRPSANSRHGGAHDAAGADRPSRASSRGGRRRTTTRSGAGGTSSRPTSRRALLRATSALRAPALRTSAVGRRMHPQTAPCRRSFGPMRANCVTRSGDSRCATARATDPRRPRPRVASAACGWTANVRSSPDRRPGSDARSRSRSRREGAAVVVTGRDAERGDAVVQEITAAGGTAHFLAADLHDEHACTGARRRRRRPPRRPDRPGQQRRGRRRARRDRGRHHHRRVGRDPARRSHRADVVRARRDPAHAHAPVTARSSTSPPARPNARAPVSPRTSRPRPG